MRITVLLLSCAACSSANTEPVGTLDASSPSSDASSADAATNLDADTPDTSDATSAPNTGKCASCTATEDSKGGCLNELQQCGQSSDCLGNLKSFNDCLTAHQSNCGTTLAAGGTLEAALWKCLSTHCATVCGTQ